MTTCVCVRVYMPRSIALAAPAGLLPDMWLCSLFSVGAVVSYTALLTVPVVLPESSPVNTMMMQHVTPV
jgi:hypothetical protein